MLYPVLIFILIVALLWFIWQGVYNRMHRKMPQVKPYETDNTDVLKEFLLSDTFAEARTQPVDERLVTPPWENEPQTAEAYREAIRFYIKIRRQDIAARYLKVMFEKFELTDFEYALAASLKLSENKFADTVVLYSKALEINPKSATYYNNRGYARLYTGAYEAAENDFTMAITMDAKFAFAYNNRGYARIMLGNMSDAFKDISQSLVLHDGNGYAYRNLGLWYIKNKEWAKAKEELEKAAAIDPFIPELDGYLQRVQDAGPGHERA